LNLNPTLDVDLDVEDLDPDLRSKFARDQIVLAVASTDPDRQRVATHERQCPRWR